MTTHWVAVLVFAVACSGCSSQSQAQSDSGGTTNTRPTAAGDIATPRTGLLIEPGPAADLGYRIGWAADIELLRGQTITSVTVLGDMVLVVEDPENMVTARKASNGDLLWKIKLGSRLETLYQPSRDGDQIFIHSGTRFFTLKADNGEVQSVARLETPVASAAAYSPQTRLAILAGSNGLIFGHSVDSNFAKWRYSLANRISNPPALIEQDVFIVDQSGTYVLLETSSGNPLWRNHTLGAVSTAPKVQGSEILVASEDGKLYAFNRTSGRDTWQYLGAERPLTATPVPLGRLIIQPLPPDGGIVALNALNGQEEWRSEANALPVITRKQDMVLFSSDRLYSIDLDDGELVTSVPTLRLQTVLPGPNESILLVSPGGRLLRLNPL